MGGRSRIFARLIVVGALFSRSAIADDAAGADRHYQKALAFVDERSWDAAAVEFERAYQLSPHPRVLYNIGETYAEAKRPVEALDAYERFLAVAPNSERDKKKRAEEQVLALKKRVGSFVLEIEPEGAEIELDGQRVGRAPLGRQLRALVGRHVVSAALEGRATASKTVTLGSEEVQTVTLRLEARPEPTGTLNVSCRQRGVSLRVDGKNHAVRKFPVNLSLSTKVHRIELTRRGYAPDVRRITIQDGIPSEIECKLAPQSPLADRDSATLRVQVNEADTRITVDGLRLRRDGRVPVGAHSIEVVSEGFHVWRTNVDLAHGERVVLYANLTPTSERRARDASRARTQRWAGIGMAAAGLMTGGLTVAVYRVNSGRQSDWETEQANLDRAWPSALAGDSSLAERQRANDDRQDTIRRWDRITLGMGITASVLCAAGTFLYFAAPRPEQTGRGFVGLGGKW